MWNNATDVNLLLDGLRSFDEYILISSSAVYPEGGIQLFAETADLGLNKYWGKYKGKWKKHRCQWAGKLENTGKFEKNYDLNFKEHYK